jgi:hypothetical protein
VTESTGTNLTIVSVRGRITGVEVTVTLHVPPDELKQRLAEVLEQLTELGIEVRPLEEGADEKDQSNGKVEKPDSPDGPLSRIARALDADGRAVSGILGIKGEQVDVFKASALPVADALSTICYAYEKGLGKNGMPYDTFKSLIEANQIKMKTPLPTVCFNLFSGGRIDRKQYEDSKFISLTPEGEKKAAATLKSLMEGSAKPRRATRQIRKAPGRKQSS